MNSGNYDEEDPVIAQQAKLAEESNKARKKAKCPPKGQKFDSAQWERQKQLGKHDAE